MNLLNRINVILAEYNELKFKLDNPGVQNWYFKMGMLSNLKRLEYLKKEFVKIQELINTGNDLYIKNLIHSFNEELFKEYNPGNLTSKMFHHWYEQGLKNKISELTEVLEFRKEFTKLTNIEDYYTKKSINDTSIIEF